MGRAGLKPVPLIAADHAACTRLAPIPQTLQALCAAFWPGPLTVALEPYATWPQVLLGGGKTLGVRVSSHPFAQRLAAQVGGLITATSANMAKRPPAVSMATLDPVFASQVDLVLDGGALAGGAPSSVVFARGESLVLLRAGAIAQERLQKVSGRPLLVP